jgi:bifunctional polynucleotide phosphatase/kinase
MNKSDIFICCDNPAQNPTKKFKCDNCNIISDKLAINPNWSIDDTLIYYLPNILENNNELIKIAAFDFDDTLIIKKKEKNEYKLKFINGDNEINKLKKLKNDGWILVIFSNQSNIGKSKNTNYLDKLINNIFDDFLNIKFPSLFYGCFISTTHDKFRKPNTEMWKYLTNRIGINNIDLKKCFFCGDAAGRNSDFSCSDRKFAYNIDIKFKTPEDFFTNKKCLDSEWKWGFQPDIFLKEYYHTHKNKHNNNDNNNDHKFVKSDNQEMIILIGPQGSGKSTFVKKYLQDFRWISQDIHKTKQKCLLYANELIKTGHNVVIDNTNPDINSRADFIKVALENNIPVRAILFDISIDLAKHLNIFREKIGIRKRVPNICYNIYLKKFEMPSVNEGFYKIDVFYDIPDFKLSKDEKTIFSEYT